MPPKIFSPLGNFLIRLISGKEYVCKLLCSNLNYMSIYFSDIIKNIGHFFSMKKACLTVHGNYITKMSAFVTPSLMPFLQTLTSSLLVEFQSYLDIFFFQKNITIQRKYYRSQHRFTEFFGYFSQFRYNGE